MENISTIDETFESLNQIINKLENKETSLEDAFVEYEKGIKLIKEANLSLNKVEKQILVLQENGEMDSVEDDKF